MPVEPARDFSLRGALVLALIALGVAFAVGAVVRGAGAQQGDDRESDTAPAAAAPVVDLQLSAAATALALKDPPRRPEQRARERIRRPRQTPRAIPPPARESTVRVMPVNVAPTPVPRRATPAPSIPPPPPPPPRVAPEPTRAPAPATSPEPSGEFDTTGEE